MEGTVATPPRQMLAQKRCSPTRRVFQINASPPNVVPPFLLSKGLAGAEGDIVEARMMVAPTAALRVQVNERPNMKAKAFHDVFLDTTKLQLGKAGCWLRLRFNGVVEELVMQYPDDEMNMDRLQSSGVRGYREVTGEDDVLKALNEVLKMAVGRGQLRQEFTEIIAEFDFVRVPTSEESVVVDHAF